MIRIEAEPWAQMVAHARKIYPNECCGALLGTGGNDSARVARIARMENARRDERRRRYVIEPLEYARVVPAHRRIASP